MKLKKYERQMMNYKLKFVTLHPCNVRMTNNQRIIHRQMTPNSQLANKYTDSLAVLHKGLVACRDTAWGFCFRIGGVN